MQYLKGLALGLAYVAPLGIQNLFVIESALQGNRKDTVRSVQAVLFFDILLSLSCYFGIGIILSRFPQMKKAITLLGGIVLCIVAVNVFKGGSPIATRKPGQEGKHHIVLTAAIVTWGNPQAILDGTLLLGAFRSTLPQSEASAFLFGILSASLVWFPSLAWFAARFRSRLTGRASSIVNGICALVILCYGLYLASSVIFEERIFT